MSSWQFSFVNTITVRAKTLFDAENQYNYRSYVTIKTNFLYLLFDAADWEYRNRGLGNKKPHKIILGTQRNKKEINVNNVHGILRCILYWTKYDISTALWTYFRISHCCLVHKSRINTLQITLLHVIVGDTRWWFLFLE
jgi:hypothetical protein